MRVRFLVDAHLQKDFLALVGTKGQQVGSFLLSGRGATNTFAIDGDGLICLRHQGAIHFN
jgi:hypothetical protein